MFLLSVISQGWMNELPMTYDPDNYHTNQTQSVFVRLDGYSLRLSRPKHNIPRRAMYNEPTVHKVEYVHQRHYDMRDSKVMYHFIIVRISMNMHEGSWSLVFDWLPTSTQTCLQYVTNSWSMDHHWTNLKPYWLPSTNHSYRLNSIKLSWNLTFELLLENSKVWNKFVHDLLYPKYPKLRFKTPRLQNLIQCVWTFT